MNLDFHIDRKWNGLFIRDDLITVESNAANRFDVPADIIPSLLDLVPAFLNLLFVFLGYCAQFIFSFLEKLLLLTRGGIKLVFGGFYFIECPPPEFFGA